MGLSPEEKKRIYEEEKVRIEAEEREKSGKKAEGGSTNLKPNVAGLLCYVGFWVTGIIFLFIERKDRLVRFHAMQSLVTFGILNIIWGIANVVRGFSWVWSDFGFSYVQWIAGFIVFVIFFTIWWVLWGVLMYRTYHGRPYRVPLFGDLAERLLARLDANRK